MEKLTRKQFDLLEVLATSPSLQTQRALEKSTGHSLGTINRVMKELCELKYVADGKITNAGIAALEPYRAKRAIFIAAGFGSRLVPITFNTPKPLVRVHGVRIIDTLLDACLAAGINEKKKAVAVLPCRAEARLLEKLSVLSDEIDAAIEALEESIGGCAGEDVTAQAFFIRDELLGKMAALRALCDEAETLTAASCWPFPTYGDLLFGV